MPEREHTYPPEYRPGIHWAVTEAWRILDSIDPGIIPDEVRFFLAGAISAALQRARQEGETG